MHVLVGSIKIDTGMFIKFVHNHKPEDAGKNFAQEGAVQFLPQPASSSFFYLFLSMAIGHMTGALAQKKSISVQSPTLKLLLYVCASKLRVASLMPNFLAIDYFGLFSPGNIRCAIALAHLHTRPKCPRRAFYRTHNNAFNYGTFVDFCVVLNEWFDLFLWFAFLHGSSVGSDQCFQKVSYSF